MQKLPEAKKFCFDFSGLLWLDYIVFFFLSCVNMTIQMHLFPNCKRPKGNQAAKRKLCIIILFPILFGFHKHMWTRKCWKVFEIKCWKGKWVLSARNILTIWVILWMYLISELPFLHLPHKCHLLRTVGYSGYSALKYEKGNHFSLKKIKISFWLFLHSNEMIIFFQKIVTLYISFLLLL